MFERKSRRALLASTKSCNKPRFGVLKTKGTNIMKKNLSPLQAIDLLKKNQAILIDVREADEFKAEHIAWAISLPLTSFETDFTQLDLPKEIKIIFQCFKGSRGQKACDIICKNPSCENEIFNLEGGIIAWKEAGLSIVKAGSSSKLSLFRQVQIIVGGLVALFVLLGFPSISALLGLALCFAGITGWCGLAMLLSKMPWNK
ncbi:rhodanese-like domain-containing protein [Alphaproteobacteria bacterium]|nr:rhodanese-like domain-containing protein [Alphaproteobacteria bacterium]